MSHHSSWHHAPPHQLSEGGTYFVTAGTYGEAHYFQGAVRLAYLENILRESALSLRWRLEAWSIFSNHYHLIAHSPTDQPDAQSLREWLADVHRQSARWVNARDEAPGRKVWHNFWETRLTFERSYLARLNYVQQNAVKHGLVAVADEYPWSSAAEFARTASSPRQRTFSSFRTDRLQIPDAFDPAPDWR